MIPIEVNGYDATWVNGVFSELKSYVDARGSTISKVHNHSVYDILLWVLGFPISFWVCSKFSASIENSFGNENTFVVSALYTFTHLSPPCFFSGYCFTIYGGFAH